MSKCLPGSGQKVISQGSSLLCNCSFQKQEMYLRCLNSLQGIESWPESKRMSSLLWKLKEEVEAGSRQVLQSRGWCAEMRSEFPRVSEGTAFWMVKSSWQRCRRKRHSPSEGGDKWSTWGALCFLSAKCCRMLETRESPVLILHYFLALRYSNHYAAVYHLSILFRRSAWISGVLLTIAKVLLSVVLE